MTNGERLQKILADAGVCSRRDAEKLISMGSVTINGRLAQLGDRAVWGKDHIKINGKLLQARNKKTLILFFKPRGMLVVKKRSIGEEESQGTIWEPLTKVKEKVFPIGNLDSDAEGLLLLTNDGDLSDRLMRAKYEVPRVYTVKIDGHLDDNRIKRLLYGIRFEQGKAKVESLELTKKLQGKEWWKVTVHRTKSRDIRKLFESVGRPVDKVRRDSFAFLNLKGLERGQMRLATANEWVQLRKLVGLAS
jgi:pseudouridine synthase